MRRIWPCLSFLLAGIACSPPVACPSGDINPIVVSLTNDSQPYVEDATVMYSVDEGDERACELVSEVGPNAYGCGTDQAGAYRITAIVDGREEAFQDADVVFSSGSAGCRMTDAR